MRENSSSSLKGFAMKPLALIFTLQNSSVGWALPLMMITGIFATFGSTSLRISRVAWKPLRPGITTSIRINAGLWTLASSMALSPS